MIKKPLFSTINTIVFPNSSAVFMIKRDFSIGAVREALANHNGELIIVSQKAMTPDRPGKDGIFLTGCICEINNELELPDGTVKFAATAKSRIKLENFVEEKGIPFGIGQILRAPKSKDSLAFDRKDKMIQKLKTLKIDFEDDEFSTLLALKPDLKDFEFVMAFANLLKFDRIKHRELSLDEKNSGVSILDALTDTEKQSVNRGMAEMQEILESDDLNLSIEKMEKLL